ncbi:odorant binding protein, partial [Rhyzopertha dominica]
MCDTTIKPLLVVITLAVLVSLSNQAKQHQQIHQFREDCIKDTGVDPSLIDKADKGDFADDEKLKCFAKCFYEKAGFIDADADLQIDAIKSKIPQEANMERAMEVIEKCRQVNGANPCEKAFEMHKCY